MASLLRLRVGFRLPGRDPRGVLSLSTQGPTSYLARGERVAGWKKKKKKKKKKEKKKKKNKKKTKKKKKP